MDITLDGSLVFSGELQQAPGNVAEALRNAECILFTDSPAALDRIEQQDAKYAVALAGVRVMASPAERDGGSTTQLSAHWSQGPAGELDLVTCTGAQSPRAARLGDAPLRPLPALSAGGSGGVLSRTVTGGRPLTAANSAAAAQLAMQQGPQGQEQEQAHSGGGRCGSAGPLLHCKQLLLVMVDTYGDSHFVGLTGLEVVGADGMPLPLTPSSLLADPPDLNVFPGHSGKHASKPLSHCALNFSCFQVPTSLKGSQPQLPRVQCLSPTCEPQYLCSPSKPTIFAPVHEKSLGHCSGCLANTYPYQRPLCMLQASCCAGDVRTLDKLLDGENNTMDDTHVSW